MKFLVDNQLPLRLAVHLRSRGHECVHVLELALDEADDQALWARAVAAAQVVVSKDEDFVFLANRPGDAGRLVWVRLGNCRNPALLTAFDRVHDNLIRALESGERIVEIR
jgi:predicted nuclease of predicted toxin-antitoxin system